MSDIDGLTDRPTVTIDKKYFSENLSKNDLSHHFFIDTGAMKITFEGVDGVVQDVDGELIALGA